MLLDKPVRRFGLALFLLGTIVDGSFMVIGPPGAPVAHNMKSSDVITDQIRVLHPDLAVSRYRNTTTESKGNFSSQQPANQQEQQVPYFWLADNKRFQHKQPWTGDPKYQAFRNVRDFGAVGDGNADDWQAIHDAVTSASLETKGKLFRCGEFCSATSTMGAIVYFPPGTYSISKPIVQYYYTSFVSHPWQPAVIKGRSDFEGIALIDTDVYIPGANGKTWWINQNNFYRQIRNFVIDTTDMPQTIKGAGDGTNGAPIGIHWQVSQACTLQNIHFKMPIGSTHYGIFMENGSGGFVSDLSFEGGKVCFTAGNQQYTARNLNFKNCETAVEMLWSWGFTWKDIQIEGSKIGFNASSHKPDPDTGTTQSTGSLTILDSTFKSVETLLYVAHYDDYFPSLVLDNLHLEGVGNSVVEEGGKVILAGGADIQSWMLGRLYTAASPEGYLTYGTYDPPRKDPSLLVDGKFFSKEKPQYHTLPLAGLFINVLDYDVRNDGVYPNNNAEGINKALKDTVFTTHVLVFPAGVYKIDKPIFVPVGTRMVGAIWSQLMAVGPMFADPKNPQVFIKVGNPGDQGTVEISDFMITGSGPTAGAIFMEWNVHQRDQESGSVAMWDTIFRVGGGDGTKLRDRECNQYGQQAKEKCMASSMMLHVTKKASIYMENMWFWVADHDIDLPSQGRINVYGARGVLIESKGPSWVHSASNEHSTLYQWQLSGAKNIYLAAIQSETPYFQAGQTASLEPYAPGTGDFPNDPEFPDCDAKSALSAKIGLDTCREAWALRILHSRNVYLYGGGFYSFFLNYSDTCSKDKDNGRLCQDKLVDTDYSENIWLYNIYTVGVNETLSPQGVIPVQKEQDQNGYATATTAYLVFANQGAKIGGTRLGILGFGDDDESEDFSGPCDFDQSPADLEEVLRTMDTTPTYCAQLHAVKVMNKVLKDVVADYDLNGKLKGYGKAFQNFQGWVKDRIEPRLQNYMNLDDGPGNKFFSCTVTIGTRVGEKTKCPPNPKRKFWKESVAWQVDYTLDDKAGFEDAIEKDLGISRDWIRYAEWGDEYSCANEGSIGGVGGPRPGAVSKPCRPLKHVRLNFPRKIKNDKDIIIYNPEELISKAMENGNITALLDSTDATYVGWEFGMPEVDPADAITAISLPIFTFQDAITSMTEIKAIGDKIAEEKKKQMIIQIVGLVFALLPLAGLAIGGAAFAGAAMLSRILLIVGEVGNTGLTLEESIKDPLAAPGLIIGLIAGWAGYAGAAGKVGRAGTRSPRENYSEAASVRRGLGVDLKGVSQAVRDKDALAQKIGMACKRR